jgi:hypothetical protein
MGTSGNGRSSGSSRCFRRRGLFLDRQSAAIAHRVRPSVSKPRDSLCQRLLMGQWPATTTTQHHSSTRTIRSLCELAVPTGRNSCSQPVQENEDNEISSKHDPTHDWSHRCMSMVSCPLILLPCLAARSIPPPPVVAPSLLCRHATLSLWVLPLYIKSCAGLPGN